jgi:hypothetical protein
MHFYDYHDIVPCLDTIVLPYVDAIIEEVAHVAQRGSRGPKKA